MTCYTVHISTALLPHLQVGSSSDRLLARHLEHIINMHHGAVERVTKLMIVMAFVRLLHDGQHTAIDNHIRAAPSLISI